MSNFKSCDMAGSIGYIYFVKSDNNLIKIGITSDLMKRICNMQAMVPSILCLEGYIEVPVSKTTAEESKLHSKFDKYRRHGEWFEYDNVIRDYVKTNCNTKCDFVNQTISILYNNPTLRKTDNDERTRFRSGGRDRKKYGIAVTSLLPIIRRAVNGITLKEMAEEFGCTRKDCIPMIKKLESHKMIEMKCINGNNYYYPIGEAENPTRFMDSFSHIVSMKPSCPGKISSPETSYDLEPCPP